MSSATQLRLFNSTDAGSGPNPPAITETEQLLKEFRQARCAARAHPKSVRREVSQLRSLARDAELRDEPSTLGALASDMALVARLLLDPPRPIARATGRARLVAVQRFVLFASPLLGLDAAAQLDRLDRLLPATRSSGWHDAGTIVSGAVGRRRRLRPTLEAADLERIVGKVATAESGAHTRRDTALVAMSCFSGLRPEEIAALCWDQVSRECSPGGQAEVRILVSRGGGQVRIPVPPIAAHALAGVAASLESNLGHLSGPVFRARGRGGRALGYRTVRSIVSEACSRAGYPGTEAADLRSAFAASLKAKGLSDHEVAEVLGLARVRSVDRLLRRHRELQAQRRVREILDRSS